MADNPATCQVEREGRIYIVNVADLAEGEMPYVAGAGEMPAAEADAAAAVAVAREAPEGGWARLTVVQLAEACLGKGISVPSGARKAELVALLEAAK